MTFAGWIQIIVLFVAVVAVTKPLGSYMYKVFAGERTWVSPVLRPVETAFYRLAGVDETKEHGWLPYAVAVLLFSLAGLLVTYAILRLQGDLPWNPQDFGAVKEDLAFNTSASFTTNTNWQAYGGESTMSYTSQMVGLAVHNFTSAAMGIAVALALIRGIARRRADSDRQLLGRHDPRRSSTCCCRYPFVRRALAGLAGRAAEPERLHRSERTWRGLLTDARLGPDRLAGDRSRSWGRTAAGS